MKKVNDKQDILLLYFSTSNFDAMRKCFEDFGFEVTENPNDQLMHMFGNGRAVRVKRGYFDFTLEETSNGKYKANFNLMLALSEEDVARLKSLGYPCDTQTGYGTQHAFQTPDGGTFLVI